MWSLGGLDVIWVRGKVVSNGWWSTRHAKPGALNVFFDVVMKVLMFIELVSRVKHPKITTVGFILKRPFVDVLSSCRSFFVFFFVGIFLWIFFYFFVSGIFLFLLWENFLSTFFFQLNVNRWAGLNFKAIYLEFFFPPKTPYLTLLSHICSWIFGHIPESTNLA